MLIKPTIPEVRDRFQAYLDTHLAWGSLHLVLDDNNVQDDSVKYCIQCAIDNGDIEGKELGEILLLMSKTQRLKIGKVLK